MKKKKSGYFWRFRKMLLREGIFYPYHVQDCAFINSTKPIFRLNSDYLAKLNKKEISYLVRNAWDFRNFFFTLLFFISFGFSFQGVGDCEKLLADYAQLTNKSVFLPRALSGSCVIQNESHIPLVLKSAGFNYALKNDVIQVSAIEKPVSVVQKKFKPKSLLYDVTFVFVNTSSVIDCGLTMRDIVATLENLDYAFTLGVSLGCPALDYDGSFAFHVNANLLDTWSYSHGNETQRQNAQITSSTGAVTNQYEYVTTGLNLTLEQNETGVFYSLKYQGNNGSVTTSRGGIVEEVRATIMDEFRRRRKFAFIPIGWESKLAQYTLVLRIVPKT